MHALTGGQKVTKEAVCSAYAGTTLRDRGVVKVYVECAECGTTTTTWLRPTDTVAPYVYCDGCRR